MEKIRSVNNEVNKTAEIVKDIEYKIINHILKPKEKLLPLRELAESYETSRSVINAAIHILSTKGYVTVTPRHYVEVNDYLESGSLDVVRDIYHFSSGNLKIKTIQEVLEIRRIVELRAIEDIVMKKESIEPLKKIYEEELTWLSESNEIQTLVPLDCAFHECIVKSSGNNVLYLLYGSFKEIEMSLIEKFYHTKTQAKKVIDNHLKLLEALLNQKVEEAKAIWSEVLKDGENVVLKEK